MGCGEKRAIITGPVAMGTPFFCFPGCYFLGSV